MSDFKVKDRYCAPKAHLQACKVGRMFGRLVKRQSAKARPRHVGVKPSCAGSYVRYWPPDAPPGGPCCGPPC